MSTPHSVIATGSRGVPAPARRAALAQLLRIRAVEETIAARYAEQEMRCPVHLSIGQEGAAVGVCAALRPEDYILSTHRGHAHYLAKGGDLTAMLAEIYGRATGCAAGKGGSMHLIDWSVGMLGCTPIVGGSLPVGVGVAFGCAMRGEERVTVICCGEAATEEGVFAESINFAALKQLPVVFVVENNGFSVYSPLSVRQPSGRDLVAMARANSLEGARGDGNDVDAVYDLARAAVERARRGDGPTVLELMTYRWREHCGPNYDNQLGYRNASEADDWLRRCPVERYRSQLLASREVTEAEVAAMSAEIEAEIAAAFETARNAPFPAADQLTAQVYAGEAR